jgi:NAD(P)-dependent dehydrogenase (short-subunit alcohol dehydrogenase family)
MGKLEGKVAIITGGAMGMGYGSAKVMAQHGAKIVLIDYADTVFEAIENLRQEGFEVSGYQLDVRNSEVLKEAYNKVADQNGKIDILVNAAGVGDLKYFCDVTDEFRDRIFDINLKGTWNSCQAAVPHMIKARYGKIVNFGSVTGCFVADPGITCYAATKGAVMAFTKALAVELAPYNITVNAILPGMTDTPMLDKSCREACPEDPQRIKEAIAANIPMKRLGTIEEAGQVVAFLASDESSYVTGTHIVFDGGSTLPESPGTGWTPGA